MIQNQEIRVVLFKGDGGWIAQGLEIDLCAQGSDPAQAQQRFAETCALESQARLAHFGDSLHGIEAAPKHFFAMWDKAESLARNTCDGHEMDIRLVA